jgi:hypothetical protein
MAILATLAGDALRENKKLLKESIKEIWDPKKSLHYLLISTINHMGPGTSSPVS